MARIVRFGYQAAQTLDRCRRGSQIGADLGDKSRTRIELVPFRTPRQGPSPQSSSAAATVTAGRARGE